MIFKSMSNLTFWTLFEILLLSLFGNTNVPAVYGTLHEVASCFFSIKMYTYEDKTCIACNQNYKSDVKFCRKRSQSQVTILLFSTPFLPRFVFFFHSYFSCHCLLPETSLDLQSHIALSVISLFTHYFPLYIVTAQSTVVLKLIS